MYRMTDPLGKASFCKALWAGFSAVPAGLAPGLEAAVNFEISELTYGLGVHAVELTVDPDTGNVSLLNYVVVNDCGKAINPQMAEGQIHGGVVHGIGNTLFEWMAYDDSAQPAQRHWQTISCLRYLKSHPSKSNLSNSRAQKIRLA
jgi:CO/xanthine dehydrogenase Mo-binding subunit